MSEWFDMKHMSKHNVGYVGHFIQSMKEAAWTVLYFVKIVICLLYTSDAADE